MKRYLEERGIDDYRITTETVRGSERSDGQGEIRRVSTIDDDKGRALNRRVEMIIKYN